MYTNYSEEKAFIYPISVIMNYILQLVLKSNRCCKLKKGNEKTDQILFSDNWYLFVPAYSVA